MDEDEAARVMAAHEEESWGDFIFAFEARGGVLTDRDRSLSRAAFKSGFFAAIGIIASEMTADEE